MSYREMYLIVFAPIYGPSGYAKLSRSFVLGLDKLGVKIKLEPNRLWEPHETILPSAMEKRLRELEQTIIPEGCNPPKLSIGISPWFDKTYPGYKIGYTMFEFANIPNVGKYDWKTSCLQMDEVWVPSAYNVRTFNDNGIHNVRAIAPGIDANEFNPFVKPLIERDDRVRFVAVGEYTPRKGFDQLIPAYLAEFSGDEKVSLILKSYNGSKKVEDSKRLIKEDILKYRQESPNVVPPHILFIGDILSNDKLASLYTSADVFIMLTRGEGFGLPMAEAMACGLPCVLPNNSSYLDFVDNNNGYLVDILGFEKYSELHKASILYKDSESPIMDIPHARRIMRHIYENVQEAREKGKIANRTINEGYTHELAASRMYQRLQEIQSYWTPQIINVVTDNFDELIVEDNENKEPYHEDSLKINVVGKNVDSIGTVGMVIPTWGENCGVADYTKRIVDKLRDSGNNIVVIKNLYNLVDTVQRQGIRLVHIQHHYALYNPQKLLDCIEELRELGVKVIITVHDYASDPKMKNSNAGFIKCNKVFVHSNMIRDKMIEDGVVTPQRIEVIIMGTEPPYSFDKMNAKKNIGLENRKIISSFGFLQPHKNWVEVIKAVSEIKKEIPEILYLLISVVRKGNAVLTQYDQLLDNTIKRLNLDNNVKRFKNYLSEERVLQMLAASDSIILPYSNYRIEGIEYWGVSIASRFSMRVQRPLIISEASFFSDLQDVCEVVTPSSTVIAKRVINLLNDSNLQKKVVMNQYNFSTVHSWDVFKEKTIEGYKAVIKEV